MLSKVAVLLLGFVAETPLSPYEITKLLEKLNVRLWFPVSDSSVYATMNNLETKRYIKGKIKKEGRMPEKTVYSLTPKGGKVLHKALEEYLGGSELTGSQFDIAILLLCHVQKERALSILEKRQKTLEMEIERVRKQVAHTTQNDVIPFTGIILMKHNLYIKEAENKTVKELMKEIHQRTRWDYFVAKDIPV